MGTEETAQDMEISRWVCQRLSALRNSEEFSDITVIVNDTEFKCHRNIMAAFSDFFQGALRSGMREARERKIILHDFDEEIFATLLTCIYDGKNVVTEDNLFDIWESADMLQIAFIVSQCEKLFNNTMTVRNCVDYLCKVRLISGKAKQYALDFIRTKSINLFDERKIALLEADEIKYVLSYEKLKVPSEDDVLWFILTWANNKLKATVPSTVRSSGSSGSLTYEESESKSSKYAFSQIGQQIADVIESTRILLISRSCLYESLIEHPLTKGSPECQAIADRVQAYQARPHQHQTWCPPAAVHRDHSEMTNVLITSKCTWDGKLATINLRDGEFTWYYINLPYFCDKLREADLIFYESKILAVTQHHLHMCWPKSKEWKFSRLFNRKTITKAFGDYLYSYHYADFKLSFAKSPRLSSLLYLNNDPKVRMDFAALGIKVPKGGIRIKEVTAIGNTHIIFCSRKDDGGCFVVTNDTSTRKVKGYLNKLGSLSGLVTFSHDNQAFALQENGYLWRIRLGDNPGDVSFTHELVLWDGKFHLNGAVLYNDRLIIVGDFNDQKDDFEDFFLHLAGVFNTFTTVKSPPDNAGISLAVLPKSLNVLSENSDSESDSD